MSTEEENNPYDLLGIQFEATEQEIRTAYRQRSLKVHPDRVSLLASVYQSLTHTVQQNRNNPDAGKL
jgi:curved DNA-binding protein CbpA